MNLQIRKSNQAPVPTTLEILLFRVAGQWLAVRSVRQLRLLSFEAALIKPGDHVGDHQEGLLGYLNRANSSFPVYDLAYLLGLAAEPSLPGSGQLLQAPENGQAVGFTIEQAQGIQRVPVGELRQLPEIVSRLRTTPAIWAVWLRSNGTLIPLLDLAFVINSNSFTNL